MITTVPDEVFDVAYFAAIEYRHHVEGIAAERIAKATFWHPMILEMSHQAGVEGVVSSVDDSA